MRDSLINKIKRAINQGNLLDKALLQIGISAGYSNNELFPVQERYKQYLRLKKQYFKKELKKYELNDSKHPKIVWICWFQGMNNAPEIVNTCYDSIRKNFSQDWSIIELTEKNIFEYVEFPNYIIEKWKKGIITNTHFSDLLRIEILIKYGGLWTDATVFYSGSIPEFIINCNFFTYHHSFRYDLAIVFESWFIYSIPKHPLLLETRDMIYKYWKKNNRLKEYFLFHLFFTLATEKYPDLWKNVPIYSDVVPHILAKELFDSYDEERYVQIKNMTNVHKLSYKIENRHLKKEDTFYSRIVKEEL